MTKQLNAQQTAHSAGIETLTTASENAWSDVARAAARREDTAPYIAKAQRADEALAAFERGDLIDA